MDCNERTFIYVPSKAVLGYTHYFEQHFSSLSVEDLYNRFLHYVTVPLAMEWVKGTVTKKVHFFFENDKGTITCLGVLGHDGEISLSVHPDYRGKGLSLCLVKYIIDFAKLASINDVWFISEMDNKPCLKLFVDELKFTISYDKTIGSYRGTKNIGENV